MKKLTALAAIAAAGIAALATVQIAGAEGGHSHYGRHHGNAAGRSPHLDHVFVIMMENTAYSDLLDPSNSNTSFIRSLASTYGLETDYYGVTHTSLPNYVAVTSGSTWGSNADDEAQADQGYFDHLNLVDQLEQAHVSWKGYMESMPSAGYTGNYGDCSSTDPDCTSSPTGNALYVRKHNPFFQYPDVFDNAHRTGDVVPLTQLTTDLNTGRVPQFVWITPNICNDMHGGAPQCPYPNTPTDQYQAALYQDGDTFLRTWVTAIMHSRAWTGHSAIFITWDEGGYEDSSPYAPEDDTGCCDSPVLPSSPANPATGGGGDLAGGTEYGGGHVPMIVVTRDGPHGVTDSTPTNHYSLLQTIEQNWRLPYLGDAGDTVQVHSLAPLLSGH
ncbi:MAG TPA: alkaline phosphatase family protein [Gaiellaceae bacterium]|nr:alkaline phosphatase family protein [Gaiellaceae bacterium]